MYICDYCKVFFVKKVKGFSQLVVNIFAVLLIVSTYLYSFSVSAKDLALPSFGDFSSSTISIDKEHQLGQFFLQQLYSQSAIVNDPLIQTYLENLVYRLATVSQLQDKRLSIVVIDNPILNAFAAPGGIIGINAGLLLYANNEPEVASVLAHELAHLSQRHFSRNIQDEKNNRLPVLAAVLGSILLTVAGAGDTGIAALTSSIAGTISHQLSFSRQQEAEADRIGIKTLYRAKFNPYAMPEMFKRLQQLNRGNTTELEFLQTHPVTLKRIADTTGLANQFPVHIYKKDSLNFELIKMRIRLLYARNINEFIRRLKGELKNKKPNQSTVTYYGLALAYLKNKDYDQANNELRKALKQNPDNLMYQVLKQKIMFANNKKSEAMYQTKQLSIDNENYLPFSMLYAHFLYESGNYRQSEKLLRSIQRTNNNNPFVLKKLADATGRAGNKAGYYLIHSQYLHLTGHTERAINQLEYALDSLRMQYRQRQAMQQQLIELKKDKKILENFSL